jgi:hypothetical protein
MMSDGVDVYTFKMFSLHFNPPEIILFNLTKHSDVCHVFQYMNTIEIGAYF